MVVSYCDEFDWACLRGVVMGTVALVTLIAAGVAFKRIAWRGRVFSQNLVMVALAALQMFILVVHCFFIRSPQLLFCEKYVRGIQIVLACLLYGNLAAELLDRKAAFHMFLVPLIFMLFILMTVNLVVMLAGENVDCHHLSWLLMSICCTIASVSFAFCGQIVIEKIKLASCKTHAKSKTLLGGGPEKELEQTHLQLWVLLVVNCFSSVLSLLLDLYIVWIVVGSKTCNAMFFGDENFALEQLTRLFLALCGFVFPEWATLYVFYWIPRHRFSTHLDVPDIDLSDGYYYESNE